MEAAALLGIGRTKAYQLAKDGLLPVTRVFGPVRVHREKLLQMIDEGIPDTVASAGGVQKEDTACRTNDRTHRSGGSATSRQMASTLDALLAPRTTAQPGP
ncbi:helix-turn-helix domain-containing protein [Pseudomonas indica]|uniref:helix-turn-helix domain-containing protein n=1 Tax=Pseudomonas indica TaxID=137658 RepID=UPI003FCF2B8F